MGRGDICIMPAKPFVDQCEDDRTMYKAIKQDEYRTLAGADLNPDMCYAFLIGVGQWSEYNAFFAFTNLYKEAW
jgi:hypothetical protein